MTSYEFPFDVDAATYSPPPPCGRPTNRGTACQQSPLAYWRLPEREGRPHSCLRHLTPQERAEYDREVAAAEVAEQEAHRKVDRMAPACWGWEIPTSLALRGAEHDVAGLAAIEEWQAGRCAICSAEGGLVTDHDHATGLIRGLLTELTRAWASASASSRSGTSPCAPVTPPTGARCLPASPSGTCTTVRSLPPGAGARLGTCWRPTKPTITTRSEGAEHADNPDLPGEV